MIKIKFDIALTEVHIGQLIKKQLDIKGMKRSEFARRINRSSQNVYDIFNRKSIDTNLLLKISDILDYNFFEFFVYKVRNKDNDEHFQEEPIEYTPMSEVESENEMLKNQLSACKEKTKSLSKEIQYLKEINTLLKKK